MKFSFREKIFNRLTIPKSFGTLGLIVIIFFFISNMINVRFIQDDAYTSFRYVKNFVEGNGLVFNPGQRVEGYTNFLWVMILSIFYFLDHAHILALDLENVAQILSVLFSVTVLILTYFLSKNILKKDVERRSLIEKLIDELVNLTPVFMLSISTPLIYWGVSGMETSFFVSLVLFSILLFLKNEENNSPTKSWIFLLVLSSLLRPEGMIVFALILTFKIYYLYKSHQEKKFILRARAVFNRELVNEILFYATPLIIYICFRLIYYGYPLPNTFYAKTDFSIEFIIRGINYFSDFARAYLLYGFVLLFPTILFYDKIKAKELIFIYWIIGAWTILNIIIGGDVLPIHRFFLPIMPLIFILFVKAISFAGDLVAKKNVWIANLFLTAAIVLIFSVGLLNFKTQRYQMMEKRSYETGLVKKMKIYANWINAQSERRGDQVSVAMSTIGAFSYYANACVIDIVGLTDGYISHHPKEVKGIDEELPVLWKERHYNADYVLSQKPDYIIFPAGAKPSAFAECALYVQDEFRKNYYTQIFYSDELHQLLPVFTRKEDLKVGLPVGKCNNKYLIHEIKANNYFLEMIQNNDINILQKVMTECDRVIYFCPQEITNVNTLKGMVYYHANDFESAKNYLIMAIDSEAANGIARYYLSKIFSFQGKDKEAIKLIGEIIRYSPDAFPNLIK